MSWLVSLPTTVHILGREKIQIFWMQAFTYLHSAMINSAYLDTSFCDRYRLLFHSFMNSNLILDIHLVKLINATYTLEKKKKKEKKIGLKQVWRPTTLSFRKWWIHTKHNSYDRLFEALQQSKNSITDATSLFEVHVQKTLFETL